MSRKKIPTKEALTQVLREVDGNMARAATHFHCSRSLVCQHVNADPELRALTDELQETFKDEAESQLFKLIREGNPAAVIFYMKTKCRDRGYSERLELLPLAMREIEVELGSGISTAHQTEALNGNGTAIALLEQ